MEWIKYDKTNKLTHPKCPNKFIVYEEKCDKMHFLLWNGFKWDSENNDITHYCLPIKPK